MKRWLVSGLEAAPAVLDGDEDLDDRPYGNMTEAEIDKLLKSEQVDALREAVCPCGHLALNHSPGECGHTELRKSPREWVFCDCSRDAAKALVASGMSLSLP